MRSRADDFVVGLTTDSFAAFLQTDARGRSLKFEGDSNRVYDTKQRVGEVVVLVGAVVEGHERT